MTAKQRTVYKHNKPTKQNTARLSGEIKCRALKLYENDIHKCGAMDSA